MKRVPCQKLFAVFLLFCVSITIIVYINHISRDVNNIARRKVRILCFVITSPRNLMRRAMAANNTWTRRCDKSIFFSSVTNKKFPTIGLNVSEGKRHLIAKTVQAFRYCYKYYRNQFDWFLKADDDTYMIMENLKHFLSHHDPELPQYFGRQIKVYGIAHLFFSGGAGYVLSRKALQVYVEKDTNNSTICEQDGIHEDVAIGRCFLKLNIKAGTTKDAQGRETFHPHSPLYHVYGSTNLTYEWKKNKTVKSV